MDYRLLGKNIQFYRKQKELTQAQLAELSVYSHTYIGSLENGRSKPSLEAVIRIANLLSVTPDQLLHDSLDCPEVYYMRKIETRLNRMQLHSRHLACEMIERLMDLIEEVQT